jgi:hypothetical protein
VTLKLFSQKRAFSFGLLVLAVVALLGARSTVAVDGALEESLVGELSPTAGRSRFSLSEEATGEAVRRLREGTLLTDQNGFFREDGDGATFVSDSGYEFGALPNLNLERVVRLLKGREEPSTIRWIVNGEVTEFTGRNFILISRAVYKSASAPPLPDIIGK